MSTRKVILLLALIGVVGLLVFLAGCGGGQEKPGAAETAEALRVLATLTAEAHVLVSKPGHLTEAIVIAQTTRAGFSFPR